MGYVFIVILVCVAVVLLIFTVTSLWVFLTGGTPYVASNSKELDAIRVLALIKTGMTTVDLGSGDGRIVIAMAHRGADAHGYELNIFFFLLSLWNIYKAGLWGRAHIHWGDFFKANLSPYDVITVYGIPYILQKLEKKLRQEKKPTAKLLSIGFQFFHLKPKKQQSGVYLYI